MLTSQSGKEFTDARRRAFIQEWLNFFTGRSNDLLSFEDIRQNLRLQDSSYRGLQEVELDKIVGSTGRYRDFNRAFLPKTDTLENRWRRVDAVTHEQGYPPIELFKVGDVYFVRDGNHRVSVARMHKSKTIEAFVVEYKTSVPITKEDDLNNILLKTERTRFFEETHLDQIRPEQNVRFTEPGRYRLVREHIDFHKHMKEIEGNCEITYGEAVASWYDNVYLPVIDLIRSRKIMKQFPNRTEADLYAWLLLHRSTLEEEFQALGYISNEDLLPKVAREKAASPLARVIALFRSQLNLKTLPLKVERSKFLKETGLDEVRPNHGVECTEPGCYQLIKEHIKVHKYLREIESNSELSYREAVASWYDHVYQPVVQLIQKRHALVNFPGHTETDLYAWLVSRRGELEEESQAMGQIPTEKIIDDFKRECTSNSIVRLVQSFWHNLNGDSNA
jgi:hypothetical protein